MQMNLNNSQITHRKRTQRGMGLVTTMLVLMGIMAMMLLGVISGGKTGGSVMDNANNAVQSSAARTRSAASFNMAEAGIQYTMAWLSVQPAPPANGLAFAPGLNFAGGPTATLVGNPQRAQIIPDSSDSGTFFTVRVYPDSYNNDINSPTSISKKYLIESVGICGGTTTILQVYVRQSSLSKYLVLLNSWNNSGNFWVSGLTTFDGPVHDNNIGADGHGANGDPNPPDGQPENILWKSAAGTPPMFTYTGDDAYSVSSPTGVSWWKDSFNSAGTPAVITNVDGSKTDQWLNVAAGGAGTVKSGTPVVDFPKNSTIQKNAATNTRTSLNSTGASLCPGGGIYIEGNVDEMVLSASGANNTNQIITLKQGLVTQRITINPATGNTVLEKQLPDLSWATVETLPNSMTNGVVYVNGNVGAQGDPKTGGLHGTVADNVVTAGAINNYNKLTIATPQDKNCNLDGSVTYNTGRKVAKDINGNPIYVDVNGNRTNDPSAGTPTFVPEDQDPNFAGTVGKAGTLGIISNDVKVTMNDYNGNPLNKFEMDGTVLASGLYDADHFDGRPVGLWENMGGYLSSTVGTFGVFGSDLTLQKGFNTQFNYDARMRNNPPPFFPTTGHDYTVVSWRQVNQTIE